LADGGSQAAYQLLLLARRVEMGRAMRSMLLSRLRRSGRPKAGSEAQGAQRHFSTTTLSAVCGGEAAGTVCHGEAASKKAMRK
jgi:hypothetical protein